MAILNYGSYYSYKKKDTGDKEHDDTKPIPAFNKIKEDWHKGGKIVSEHRSKIDTDIVRSVDNGKE